MKEKISTETGANPFDLLLIAGSFKKGDIVSPLSNRDVEFKILSVPKPHYKKWYYRVLNFITFKLFFNTTYTYKVKKILNEKEKQKIETYL